MDLSKNKHVTNQMAQILMKTLQEEFGAIPIDQTEKIQNLDLGPDREAESESDGSDTPIELKLEHFQQFAHT